MPHSEEEYRQINWSGKFYQLIPQPPPDFVRKPARRLEPVAGTRLGAVVIQGASSTSDPTKGRHFHVAKLVALLRGLSIPHILFSYRGSEELDYEPWDTQVEIASRARTVSDFVSAFPDGKILLFGHSQGGNLAAYWTYQHASEAQLQRLQGVFLFACPLLQPEPLLLLENEYAMEQMPPRYQLWLKAVTGYGMDLTMLTRKLSGNLVTFRCWDDPLAPAKNASLLDLPREDAPRAEFVTNDVTHSTICNDDVVLHAVRGYVDRFVGEA